LNAAADVRWLNELDSQARAALLRRCCGSDAWIQAMVTGRPFLNRDDLMLRSDQIWQSLRREDWLQAFAAHPRIGSRAAEGWAAGEQAGARDADRATLSRLSDRNREYESRFGYIFIVCATGKSAGEMLTLLEARLNNDPDAELRVAAEEQRKIMRLRLDKLLDEPAANRTATKRPGA
jgi:2-oxo-4-hydroxy-4-carboxy-5-ureidoimidazoline decarboxylase